MAGALTGDGGGGRAGGSIASEVVGAVRTLLRDRHVWDAVATELARRSPEAAARLTRSELADRCSLDDYALLLEVAHGVLDDEALLAIGRARVAQDLRGGYFGGILRAWLRSVGSSPGDLLRICPHLWKAAVTGGGDLVVEERGDSHLRMVLRDAPPAVLRCRPWHLALRGIVEGILAAGQIEGRVHVGPSRGDPHLLELLVRWRS